jgi:hypothetical protein
VDHLRFIEKGGLEQVVQELEAYNPLIPNGQELVATFMIGIDDPGRRKRILGGLGGIEESTFIAIGGARIIGVPEADRRFCRKECGLSSPAISIDANRAGNGDSAFACAATSAMKRASILAFFIPGTSWRPNALFLF